MPRVRSQVYQSFRTVVERTEFFKRFAMHYPIARLALLLAVAFPLVACGDLFGPGRDRAAPSIQLGTPLENAAVESDSVVVQGEVTDERGVVRVWYRLNGGAPQTVEVEPGKKVSFRFVVHGLALGDNEVEVLAEDGAGNEGSARRSFVMRDVAAPSIRLDSPQSQDSVRRDSVRVAGTVSDERAVTALSYSLCPVSAPDRCSGRTAVEIAPGRAASFAFPLPALQPEDYDLVMAARDESGNETVDSVRFTATGATLVIESLKPDTVLNQFAVAVLARVTHNTDLARITFSIGGKEITYCDTRVSSSCGFEKPGRHGLPSKFLDPLPQGQTTIGATAYDSAGRVLATAAVPVRVDVPARRYAVRYLGTLGGADSRGYELNEAGQVVGVSEVGSGGERVFVWDGSRLIDLGLATKASFTRSFGINERGEVVGSYQTAECERAFYWKIGEAAGPRDLDSGCGVAGDINDQGKIAITRGSSGLTREGYILSGGTWTPLVRSEVCCLVSLNFINNRDQVVGATSTFFTWNWFYTDRPPQSLSKWAGVSDLNDKGEVTLGGGGGGGTIAGEYRPIGFAVNPGGLNNRSQAAGMFSLHEEVGSATVVNRPFFWDDGRVYTIELDDPAWEIDRVEDINDAGVILAHGRHRTTGSRGAVLLTHAP